MHRTLCARCLEFLPSAGPLLLLPPAPAPLRGLWCPARRLELFQALDGWHATMYGLPVVSVREMARPDPVEMWFEGWARIPGVPGPSVSLRGA